MPPLRAITNFQLFLYKDLSAFDFAASEMGEAMVRQLHRRELLNAAGNVVLIGGPGTGKSHIATALGIQAIEHHSICHETASSSLPGQPLE